MTTRRIRYTRPDGGVSVIVPAPEFVARFNTEDDAFEAIKARSVPATATSIVEIDVANLPPNREFRNAWRVSGGSVDVDMPLARGVHAERIANAQVAEIARLKVEERKERLKGNTSQADTHATTVTALEALDLNVLATQIGAAPNPKALSAIWPANMPRP